jgi:RNA 2',3'-cyclic 3'-phosphodiesterase
MNAIRSFIAIDLPENIQEKLGAIIHQMDGPSTSAVRWVPAKNIHLTLKFLGDISPTNLQVLTKILDVEAQRFPSFEISIGNLGAFPNIRRPRVIWVGIKAPQSLGALQHAIDVETQRLGYTAEDRPFSPHLTLGRVSHNATPQEAQNIGNTLGNMQVGELGIVQASTIRLFRSDLLPSGAVYTSLHISPLARPNHDLGAPRA